MNKDKNPKLLIDTKDYRGTRVIFTHKKWKQKSIEHIWLQNEKFLSYVRTAIEDPREVWQDLNDPKNKRCYYFRYGVNLYAKVVIWNNSKPAHVVTAYDYSGVYFVKESNYPKLRRIYEE